MLAIFEAISGVAKALVFLVEIVGFLFDIGCGLRWLLSPSFRRELRQPGRETEKSMYVGSAIYTCLLLALALVVLVVFVCRGDGLA